MSKESLCLSVITVVQMIRRRTVTNPDWVRRKRRRLVSASRARPKRFGDIADDPNMEKKGRRENEAGRQRRGRNDGA